MAIKIDIPSQTIESFLTSNLRRYCYDYSREGSIVEIFPISASSDVLLKSEILKDGLKLKISSYYGEDIYPFVEGAALSALELEQLLRENSKNARRYSQTERAKERQISHVKASRAKELKLRAQQEAEPAIRANKVPDFIPPKQPESSGYSKTKISCPVCAGNTGENSQCYKCHGKGWV